jgi:hypothetical protein
MRSSAKVERTDKATLKDMKIPVALVVAGTEAIIGAVSDAALSAQVLVAECGVADATNTAAQMRPLVMVIPAEVYDTDAEGFDALAQDVRAQVMRVPTGFDLEELERDLLKLMLEAENKRPSWSDQLK